MALKRIHSIYVDFDNKNANVTTFSQVDDGTGQMVDDGTSANVSITNPAFDQMITDLTNSNALNMAVLIQYLSNL